MLNSTLGITAAVAGVLAQQVGGFGIAVQGGRTQLTVPLEWSQQFQQAGTIGVATGRGMAVRSGPAGQVVTGRAISATEERRSVQTLGDGTEISTSDSNLFIRDSQGRTRVEQTLAGRTMVSITDPVAHTSITLNTDLKQAHKTASAQLDSVAFKVGEIAGRLATTASGITPTAVPAAGMGGGRGGRGGGRGGADNTRIEDLGVQSVNGVLATGTRTTVTIPQGQIGNNRDIHVVYERWYSEDLQMLIKTVNSDPRFGDSTYELTNISRDEPDPALFQIPPDYIVVEAGGRGGRGQATPVTVINK